MYMTSKKREQIGQDTDTSVGRIANLEYTQFRNCETLEVNPWKSATDTLFVQRLVENIGTRFAVWWRLLCSIGGIKFIHLLASYRTFLSATCFCEVRTQVHKGLWGNHRFIFLPYYIPSYHYLMQERAALRTKYISRQKKNYPSIHILELKIHVEQAKKKAIRNDLLRGSQ